MAAADARLQLARDGRSPRLTLTNPKQKDAMMDLRLEPVAGSCVLSVVTPIEAAHDAQAAAGELRERVYAFIVDNGPVSKRGVLDGVKGVGKPRTTDALNELVDAGRVCPTGKGRGDGYEACPDPSGTVGHGDARSHGGSVPGQGEIPEGDSRRGTLRDPASQSVPEAAGR